MDGEAFSFSPLGGGREIGANSFYFEWDELRFLIDCGAEPGKIGYFALPELHRIRSLDFVFITHAHQDHIGSLPYLIRLFPDVSIFMTQGTFDLAGIMLYDALKFLRVTETVDGEPMFTRDDVDTVLSKATIVEGPFERDSLRITPFSSGHILGGVGLLLEKNGKRVVFSSDICFEKKTTAPPIEWIDSGVDLVILESTYGRDAFRKTLPESRSMQMEKMVDTVRDVLDAGGSLLFPSFVIERAQEILLLLNRAMEQGRIKTVRIRISGLAVPVSALHEATLGIELGGEPLARGELEELLGSAEPFILISGSGMLNAGSTSSVVASHLMSDPRSAIILTGYCAPGSTAHRLLEERPGPFFIHDHFIRKKRAAVHQFHFSCHASGPDLLRAAVRCNPAKIILMHGDEDSIEVFRRALHEEGYDDVHAPANGETIAFSNQQPDLLVSLAPLKRELVRLRRERHSSLAMDQALLILQKQPWDLDALDGMIRSGGEDRDRYARKYYLILKTICEKEKSEGNFSVALEALNRLKEVSGNRYVRKTEQRLREWIRRERGKGAILSSNEAEKINEKDRPESSNGNFGDKAGIVESELMQ